MSEILTKSRTDRLVNVGFIIVWLVLLAYGARQWITDDPEAFRPRQFTVMIAACLLQPISAILHERHRAIKLSLLALSLAGIGVSLMLGS